MLFRAAAPFDPFMSWNVMESRPRGPRTRGRDNRPYGGGPAGNRRAGSRRAQAGRREMEKGPLGYTVGAGAGPI